MPKIFNNAMLRQYVVVIAVNLNILATGVAMSWSSPVLVKLADSNQTVLPSPITEEQGSWIVSIGTLTSIAANLFVISLLVDRLGRKYSLMISCVPKIVGGFILIFASEVWMLLLGRGLQGFGEAATFTVLPMYCAEIASKEIRGTLGTIIQIMVSIGVLIMLSVGPFVSYVTLNIVQTGITAFCAVPLFILPDSPYFLYSKGRKAQTLKVLTFLRGSESIANDEMREYEIGAKDNGGSISKLELIKNRLFLKSLFLVLTLACGAQLGGFSVISLYLQTILESTQTSVMPEIASVIIGFIQLFSCFCTTLVTDRFGRKPILIVTGFGMALGMLGLGIFFKLKDADISGGVLNYLPLTSLILVVFCYSAGLGALLSVLNPELFDDQSRGFGMSISVLASTTLMFIISKYFPIVSLAIGPAATYWIFSVVSVLFTLFIMFCIPETKGKTFAQIQDILKRRKIIMINLKKK